MKWLSEQYFVSCDAKPKEDTSPATRASISPFKLQLRQLKIAKTKRDPGDTMIS